MIAEDIKRKLEVNASVQFTRIEKSYLSSLLGKVILSYKNNNEYYRINESMTNRRDRWTEGDVQYLKDACERGERDIDIAKALGRSIKGVERKRYKLGLKKIHEE